MNNPEDKGEDESGNIKKNPLLNQSIFKRINI